MRDPAIVAEILVIAALAVLVAAWLFGRLARRELCRGYAETYCEERIQRAIRLHAAEQPGFRVPED